MCWDAVNVCVVCKHFAIGVGRVDCVALRLLCWVTISGHAVLD